MAAGTITGHHARVLLQATSTAGADTARVVDSAVHAGGGWRTPRQAEQAARRLVLTVDPAGSSRRHRAAVAGRDVRFRPSEDGMATMWAALPAEDAAVLASALDAITRSGLTHPTAPAGAAGSAGADGDADGRDARTLAHRRADALVALATDRLAAPDAPLAHGRAPRVHVTVSWSTLIGIDDQPADLTGYGPIDADTARRIAADPTATWHRLLTDPASGRVLDYGRTCYRPPQDLTDFVTARDTTCRHPGCDRPATGADLDHRRRWTNHGGHTSAANIDILCRRHHRLKDEGGWHHHRDPHTDDSIWTDPRGRSTTKPAHRPPRPPDLDPPPF